MRSDQRLDVGVSFEISQAFSSPEQLYKTSSNIVKHYISMFNNICAQLHKTPPFALNFIYKHFLAGYGFAMHSGSEIKKGRAVVAISILPEMNGNIDLLLQRSGMSKQTFVTRVLVWFMSQPDSVRMAILDNYPLDLKSTIGAAIMDIGQKMIESADGSEKLRFAAKEHGSIAVKAARPDHKRGPREVG